MFRRSLIGALLCCASVPLAARAEPGDTRFEYRITEGAYGLTSIRLAGSRMRVDWGDESLIVEIPSGTVLMVEHQRKTFSRITDATRGAFFKGVADALAEARKALESLTPDERKELVAQQPELAAFIEGGSVTVEPGGDATVAGRTCTVQRFMLNKAPTVEACLASPDSLAITGPDAATFKAALTVVSGFTKPLQKLLGQSPSTTSLLSETSIPLRQTIFALGLRHTSEFVGITHETLSKDVFSIPHGYTETKPGG